MRADRGQSTFIRFDKVSMSGHGSCGWQSWGAPWILAVVIALLRVMVLVLRWALVVLEPSVAC